VYLKQIRNSFREDQFNFSLANFMLFKILLNLHANSIHHFNRRKTKHLMKFLEELEQLLINRKKELPEKSYTADLFKKGIDRILKKVGEEAGEVIIAAKNSDEHELVHEISDLLFHLQVLLVEKNIPLSKIEDELKKRHGR
jgi:phosphoribosyl-ATP pyrophosphohydrolase